MFQEKLLVDGFAVEVVGDVPPSPGNTGQQQVVPTTVPLAGGGYAVLWINQTGHSD